MSSIRARPHPAGPQHNYAYSKISQDEESNDAGGSISDLNAVCLQLQMELDSMLRPEAFVNKKHDATPLETISLKLYQLQTTMNAIERKIAAQSDQAQSRIWNTRLRQYQKRRDEFQAKLREKQRSFSHNEAQERLKLLGQSSNLTDSRSADMAISAALDSSINIAEQAIQQGSATLEGLREQGNTLRRAYNGLLQIGDALGLSNSLLGVINRREWGDKVIVYLGVCLVVMFLCFVYYILG